MSKVNDPVEVVTEVSHYFDDDDDDDDDNDNDGDDDYDDSQKIWKIKRGCNVPAKNWCLCLTNVPFPCN